MFLCIFRLLSQEQIHFGGEPGNPHKSAHVRFIRFYQCDQTIYQEGGEQAFRVALRQPSVRSFSDFVFVTSAYVGVWPLHSLVVSSFHRQRTISSLIIAELTRECR